MVLRGGETIRRGKEDDLSGSLRMKSDIRPSRMPSEAAAQDRSTQNQLLYVPFHASHIVLPQAALTNLGKL